MQTNNLYPLQTEIFKLHPQASNFLMNYSSNTPDATENAFLSKDGKLVITFHQITLSAEESWLVFPPQFEKPLRQHLGKYLDLCDTLLEKCPMFVYVSTEPNAALPQGTKVIKLSSGVMIFSPTEWVADLSEDEFTSFRLQAKWPVQGIDYHEDMLLNIHPTRYTSFEKGCYLGQEIIARVHYKGKPPKKLTVRNLSECDESLAQTMTSKALNPKTGEIMGFVCEKI